MLQSNLCPVNRGVSTCLSTSMIYHDVPWYIHMFGGFPHIFAHFFTFFDNTHIILQNSRQSSTFSFQPTTKFRVGEMAHAVDWVGRLRLVYQSAGETRTGSIAVPRIYIMGKSFFINQIFKSKRVKIPPLAWFKNAPQHLGI